MISSPPSPGDSPRGKLKIYLGYAAGVGKTFQMLRDAQDAVRRGVDLAVGYIDTHKQQDTLALAEGLEAVPRGQIVYRGQTFAEMDTAAILKRRPQLCLVDEFAHANVPGAEREKRWEDVLALLDAGMDVWTTMNVQHIESLNDAVLECTGIRVLQTVPDWVVKQAVEMQFVDVTPEALLNRLRRGAVYTGDLAEIGVEKFFRESNLRALRELAMREAAHEVQVRQSDYDARAEREVRDAGQGAEAGSAPQAAKERILVLVTSDPATAMLVRRGRRVADYLSTDCLALYVHRQEHFSDLPSREREDVERHLNFARNLRIETRTLQGQDIAQTVVDFARRNLVTQIFLARPAGDSRRSVSGSSLIRRIIRCAHDVQITVVGNHRRQTDEPSPATP